MQTEIKQEQELEDVRTCVTCHIEKDNMCFNRSWHDNDYTPAHWLYKTQCAECENKKKCTSCKVVKMKNKFKYDYDECTACYAKKKNPNPNQYGIRLNSRAWA